MHQGKDKLVSFGVINVCCIWNVCSVGNGVGVLFLLTTPLNRKCAGTCVNLSNVKWVNYGASPYFDFGWPISLMEAYF